MISSPLVSVIIPCYNHGRFIAEALNSILLQTYTNWECIVVNDGSTDKTEEIVLKYSKTDPRILYISQQNKGLGPTRNVAISHSKGVFLQLLDADDMLQPAKIEMQVELFQKHKHIGLIYSDILKFEDRPGEKREFVLYHQPEQFPETGTAADMIKAFMVDNFFLPGCVMMRRKVFDDAGKAGFKKLNGLEDLEFWLRVVYSGWEFYHDAREGTRLLTRHHGDNMSFQTKPFGKARLMMRSEIIRVFKDFRQHNKLNLNTIFLNKTYREHRRLQAVEKTIYHLSYGNVLKGLLAIIPHAWYSRRPFFAVYDGAHFLKQRIKRTGTKSSAV